MLQLGGLKLFLYVDLFYLIILFYFLFCFTPLPHYFHVSHPVCPSSDTPVNPYCTKRNDDSNHTIDFWGRKGNLFDVYTKWGGTRLKFIFALVKEIFLKDLSRNFTSFKRNKVYYEPSFQSASTPKHYRWYCWATLLTSLFAPCP